jgi:hypothetical protein
MNDTIAMILERMTLVKGAQAKFYISLFMGYMSFVGRATYRNLSRYSAYSEKSYGRWGSRSFDYAEFNTSVLTERLGGERICSSNGC